MKRDAPTSHLPSGVPSEQMLGKGRHDHRPPLQRLAGFTLIELLVVIAIIAVLLALVIPSASRMLQSARQTQCLANLKQIGVAISLYVGENDGTLPRLQGDDGTPWQFGLSTYIPAPKDNPVGSGSFRVPLSQSVFHCPSADKKKDWNGTSPDYAASARPFDLPGWPGVISPLGNQPLKVTKINNPSRCLMVADAYTPGQSVYQGRWIFTNILNLNNITAALPPSGLAPRHGYNGTDARTGRFGSLFCDGHAEMISYGDSRLADPSFQRDFLVPY